MPGTSYDVHALETFIRHNGNAEKMVAFMDSKSDHENVILLTSNKGIMDLITEFKKSRPGSESFYKKLDRAKFTKLKSGRLSFVGIPNKKIKKGMKRIPSPILLTEEKPAAKISKKVNKVA